MAGVLAQTIKAKTLIWTNYCHWNNFTAMNMVLWDVVLTLKSHYELGIIYGWQATTLPDWVQLGTAARLTFSLLRR